MIQANEAQTGDDTVVVGREILKAALHNAIEAYLADEKVLQVAKARSRSAHARTKSRKAERHVAHASAARARDIEIDQALDAAIDQARASNAVGDPIALNLFRTVYQVILKTQKQHSEDRIERLVDLMIDAEDPVAPVRAAIDRDNAEARTRFLQEIPTLTSESVAAAAGHLAKNRSQSASRWKRDKRIFAVTVRGRDLYPAFQFRNGEPLPVISEILSALPEGMSSWEIAFWFVSSNAWLDGQVPMNLLEQPKTLVEAARLEGDEFPG